MSAGVEGNARLTSVNGAVLLVLLAVEGLTVLSVGRMITLHVFLGVLLLGPVLLKCATTMYRFGRYYRGADPYLEKGPPPMALRVLGPVVIVSTLAVIGTGIGLVFTGPGHPEPLLFLHKASFVIWFGAMTIHVLGHLFEAGRTTWHEIRDRRSADTARLRGWRAAAIVFSLAAGVVLAVVVFPYAHGWTGHSDGRFSSKIHRTDGAGPLTRQ